MNSRRRIHHLSSRVVGQPTAVGAAWERAITFGFGPSEVASWERSDEERTHRYDETERSGGLHVDHQLEFGWKERTNDARDTKAACSGSPEKVLDELWNPSRGCLGMGRGRRMIDDRPPLPVKGLRGWASSTIRRQRQQQQRHAERQRDPPHPAAIGDPQLCE
jgi:hypothetical protein